MRPGVRPIRSPLSSPRITAVHLDLNLLTALDVLLDEASVAEPRSDCTCPRGHEPHAGQDQKDHR